MKDLESVIQVREIPPVCRSQRPYLPSLRDLVSGTPRAEESRVLSYLGQGVDCGLFNDPGMLFDVLQPGTRIEMFVFDEFIPERRNRHPHVMLTDGVWVWPAALLYYVSRYHIQLPEAFLRHAAHARWMIDAATIHREELNWDAFDAIRAPEFGVR